MSRSILERRLVDVSERLKRLRAELAVTEEQLAFLEEEADDARLRALVAETPLGDAEARDARRHADAIGPPPGGAPRPIAALGTRAGRRSSTAWPPSSRPREPRGHDNDPTASSSPRTRRSSASTSRSSSKRRATRSWARPAAATRPSSSSARPGPTSPSSTSRCRAWTGSPRPATSAASASPPCSILTAFSQRDLIDQAREAGALAYIVKPFQKSDLIPAIEVALGRHAELASPRARRRRPRGAARGPQAHRPGEGHPAGPARPHRAGELALPPDPGDVAAGEDGRGRPPGDRR